MKKIYALIAGMILAIGMLVAPAFADESTEPCVPSDAVYETVVIEPAQDAVYKTVEHPAEYEYIDHDAVLPVTENEDTWYSYNPAVDVDGDVNTGYPVGDREADKKNGWQVNSGSHTGQYDDPNFKIGVPWQEGQGGGSWFYVSRETVIVTPGKDAWTEKKLVKDAWSEEVLVTPAKSAVTEQRKVRDAVVCEPEVPETPETPETPEKPETPNKPEAPGKPEAPKPPVDKPEIGTPVEAERPVEAPPVETKTEHVYTEDKRVSTTYQKVGKEWVVTKRDSAPITSGPDEWEEEGI